MRGPYPPLSRDCPRGVPQVPPRGHSPMGFHATSSVCQTIAEVAGTRFGVPGPSERAPSPTGGTGVWEGACGAVGRRMPPLPSPSEPPAALSSDDCVLQTRPRAPLSGSPALDPPGMRPEAPVDPAPSAHGSASAAFGAAVAQPLDVPASASAVRSHGLSAGPPLDLPSPSEGPSQSPTPLPRGTKGVSVVALAARGLRTRDPHSQCDPFLQIRAGLQTARTSVQRGTAAPVWQQPLRFDVSDASALEIGVHDDDTVLGDLLGTATVVLALTDPEGVWVPLTMGGVPAGEVCLAILPPDNRCGGPSPEPAPVCLRAGPAGLHAVLCLVASRCACGRRIPRRRRVVSHRFARHPLALCPLQR